MNKLTQIILIHPKKFVSKAYEAFAKSIPLSVYTLDQVADFTYLIDELRPQLVLIHEELLLAGDKLYFEQITAASFQDFKQVLITSKEPKAASDILNNFSLVLKEPYDVSNIENILNSLLAEHH